MKHNKKRNTAFLYECLIRELTKAVIREDKQRQAKVKHVLKEFFTKGKTLSVELDIYRSLLESKGLTPDFSRRLLHESKVDFKRLDRTNVFNNQTKLISIINKQLGGDTFGTFVPNYKDLATIGLFLQQGDITAKKRIMLEDNCVRYLGRNEKVLTEMKHIDRLEFNMFTKRFNETYQNTLLVEQKELLSNFITSFSDNGLGLKSYLNFEIGRLKEAVTSEIVKTSNPSLLENFKKVKNKLESYSRIPLSESVVEEVFYIQDLLAEVKRNEI
tara:strand:- start:851 stop:1666 length:816 start_codon:yes stop_codon:yes gene_type:complete